MSLINSIGRGLDKLVGVLSPRAEFHRTRTREILQSRYAAAKTSRLTGDWRPVDEDINTLIGTASPLVRARVRQLVRDFPIFANAVNVLIGLTIGPGIAFQSAAEDESARDAIEEAFTAWAKTGIDSSGKLNLKQLSKLVKRQELECGELIILKRFDASRKIPITFTPIEPDRLAAYGGKPVGSNKLDQGIEYDRISGGPVAYHFTDPDSYSRTLRVEAADVIHWFDTLRPGQLRGITRFAPAVLLANDLMEYLGAEVDGAKMASKWLAFVSSGAGGFPGADYTTDPETGRNIETLENGIIEYLGQGQEIKLASHNRPGDNFQPFVKLLLLMVSVTTGCSYERLSGDYSGVSFSALRAIKNGDVERARDWQGDMVDQVFDPIFVDWLDAAVLSGRLRLTGYWSNPDRYRKAKWFPPGLESTDQLRDAKGSTTLINGGLMSPQEVISQRGRDTEEVLDEIAKFKEMAEARGISINFGSTAQANNPAALGASES